MRRLVLWALALGFLGLAVAPARGDEILEAARKERARREALRKKREKLSGKAAGSAAPVLGNDDLKHSGGTVSTATRSDAATGEAEVAKPEAGAADKQEQYWRDRMREAEAGVEKAKRAVSEANSKINELRRQTGSIDDPQVRYRNNQELLKTQADLPKLQQAVADAEKAVAGVKEEARRAGASPGWLR